MSRPALYTRRDIDRLVARHRLRRGHRRLLRKLANHPRASLSKMLAVADALADCQRTIRGGRR